jgi:hypothetical protein
MKMACRLVATLALLLGGLIVLAPTASADTPRCVSRAENRRVDLGMTRKRVHNITDTHGIGWDGHAGGYTRRYEPCWRTRKHLYWTFYATTRRVGRHKLGERVFH